MVEFVRRNQMVTYVYRFWHSRILPIYRCSFISTNISRKDIEVIFHCRRSLLFHDNKSWIKKDSNGDFDVAMESYDGAEVCELAGLFMLNELSKRFDKDNIELL